MIIYVAGAQRSGTTLLGQMLSEVDNSVLVGELRPVFSHPTLTAACDCGAAAVGCPFWSSVGPETMQLAAAGRGSYRLLHLPRLLLARRLPSVLDAQDRLVVDYLRRIGAAATDRKVIDTSKSPSGIVLWRLAGFQVSVVQCVRSLPRVVAAQRQSTSTSGLPTYSRPLSIAAWLMYHCVALALRPLATASTTIHYRRLVEDPHRELLRLSRELDLELRPDARDRREFEIGVSHMRSGNPRRATAERLAVRRPEPRSRLWSARDRDGRQQA